MDNINDVLERKQSLALAYHGDSGFYFQHPDAYEYDLEKEVERLQDELFKCDFIDKCNALFNSISNEKLLKIDLDYYKKLYYDMWKSRSAYIDAFSYLLIKLLKLTNKNEVFPIIRNIICDNNVVDYSVLDDILEVYNGKIN